MKTRITELFGIEYPVIQGGMAAVSDADLTAAVSNAGGLGILNSVGSAEALRENIRRVRELTTRDLVFNVMLLMKNVEEISQVIIEEKVPVVSTGAGSPKNFIAAWKAAGIKVMPVVPSAKVAKKMEDLGADAVVCSGMEAGGHIGEVSTLSMIPVAHRLCTIPIVAAGGIGDGRGVAGAFAMGAEGVQCGHRLHRGRRVQRFGRVQGRHCQCAGERHAGLPQSRHGAQRAHRDLPPGGKVF